MRNDYSLKRTALLVDACGELTRALQRPLTARDFEVRVAKTPLEALRIVMTTSVDVMACDLEGACMSLAAFEAAVQRVRPSLAGRCFFIAPAEAAHDSREALVCHRPLDIPELLRTITFLAAQPVVLEDATLVD